MRIKLNALNGIINQRMTTVEENIAAAACSEAIVLVRGGRVNIQSVEAAIWLLETGAGWMELLECCALADIAREMARRVIRDAIDQGYEELHVKKINRKTPGKDSILFLR